MKKKTRKALPIFIMCLGIAAVLLVCFAFFGKYYMDSRSEDKQYKFQMDLFAIGDAYLASGNGEDARRAVETFLNDIPADIRDRNNVVILDKSGRIRLKANSKFLYTESDTLTMAWDSHAVIFDKETGTRHWIGPRMESIAEADSGFVRTVGDSGMTQPELRAMFHDHWAQGEPVEAEAQIEYIGDQKNPMYLLWLMDPGVFDKVYRSLDLNAGIGFLPFAHAGVILFLVYWLLTAAWVFLDARRKGLMPLPWALLALLTNLVGVAVYWIVNAQNKPAPMPACPACGKAVGKGHLYCPWCAAPLARCCGNCHRAVEQDWTACPWCGSRLT